MGQRCMTDRSRVGWLSSFNLEVDDFHSHFGVDFPAFRQPTVEAVEAEGSRCKLVGVGVDGP